jgi:hypothetical protein
MSEKEYENLHNHMKHHKVKEWLLRGCEREDANTIRMAVENIPEHRLIRRLARALIRG